MNVGIMGGTFDPIHLGHLLAAESAREAAGLDEVWFMPTYVPPHKQQQPLASPEDRLEMVRLAVEDNPFFQVTYVELRRGGVSYTAETMEQLTAEHPNIRFSYIIGADMVLYLPRWYRIAELAARIRFIGLARPGYVLDFSGLPEFLHDRVTIAPMHEVDISSTRIRDRAMKGQSLRYLVPEAVLNFVESRGLYGYGTIDPARSGGTSG